MYRLEDFLSLKPPTCYFSFVVSFSICAVFPGTSTTVCCIYIDVRELTKHFSKQKSEYERKYQICTLNELNCLELCLKYQNASSWCGFSEMNFSVIIAV